jgi:serine/threonine protein kinase
MAWRIYTPPTSSTAKSLNVLIDGSCAVITDFGLSRLRSEVSKSTSKTGNGLQSTPGFVAPELLAGAPLDRPGDMYGFAMTAYEVVSKGRYPFDEISNAAAAGIDCDRIEVAWS